MTQSPLSYYQEKLVELSTISSSVNEENCFSKLIEYFGICREVSKREKTILKENFSGLREAVSLFLLQLPYCQIEEDDLKVLEQCEDDEFLGCRVEDQKYIRSFMRSSCENRPVIFTYCDTPTKDSITIYCKGINRTLEYIEKEEKDQTIVEAIREMVCHDFFDYQKEAIHDSLSDIALFYRDIARRLQTHNLTS